MNPKPLADLGFRVSDHRSALWWLGSLYGRPWQFKTSLRTLSEVKANELVLTIYIHGLPYLLLLIIFIILIFHYLETGLGIALGIVLGGALGFPLGIGFVEGEFVILMYFITILIAMAIAFIDQVLFFGIFSDITVGIMFLIPSGITFGIIFPQRFFGIIFPRYFYLKFPFGFVLPRLQPWQYPEHPVVWDDSCNVTFVGLDELLASYTELNPHAGELEIARLIDHYPAQKWTGLRAKTRWLARQAGQETQLALLAYKVAGLPEGEEKFLSWTGQVKVAVTNITSVQQRIDTQSRPFLRASDAELLCAKINTFQSIVAGYPEPLSTEFRQAAIKWLAIAEAQQLQIRRVLDKEPSPQVFRAGDPVQRNQEAFVPRLATLGELDRQLTLATGCPGVILYARRRIGKSTLLMNLDGFLPTSIRIAVIGLQNPEAFFSQSAFLNHVLQTIASACPEALSSNSRVSDLPEFFQRLEICNHRLESNAQRLLLAIDEYENIDRKIGEGVFQEDLLHTLRQSIQYHRHIIWLFAGSHAIEELHHASWSSYLISARTVEILPFSLEETRLLLTEPLKHSRLWLQNDPKRPHYEAGFWGLGGIEKIHAEAGGWPHLVQLLAETAVDLCNDREQHQLDSTLLEEAIVKAITSGDTVLRQLLRGEANETEWDYLSGFRRHDTQPPPEDDVVYSALRRRLLVSDTEKGEWRLRVPLMHRWLRARG